jgi:hypothetical protein
LQDRSSPPRPTGASATIPYPAQTVVRWIAELSKHGPNGGEAQECERLAIEALPIFGQPSAAIEPGDGAFDDPGFGDDRETDRVLGALDDFNLERGEDFHHGIGELRSLIATIGEQLLQEWEHAEQRRQNKNAAIAILDVGQMNDGMQQKAQCIDENMPLLALDLLACIIAPTDPCRSPFSALFTLWLSIMAAVGLASRSSCSRHS